MSNHSAGTGGPQSDPFEDEAARFLLDQLLADSKLCPQSKDCRELLDFVFEWRVSQFGGYFLWPEGFTVGCA